MATSICRFQHAGSNYKIEAKFSGGNRPAFSLYARRRHPASVRGWMFVTCFADSEARPIRSMSDAVAHAKQYCCNPSR